MERDGSPVGKKKHMLELRTRPKHHFYLLARYKAKNNFLQDKVHTTAPPGPAPRRPAPPPAVTAPVTP
jgi:hypothetical protein